MDSSIKAITAVLGLLTAVVVLVGAVTDQGWLPSFIKGPTQSALPGQQPGESGGDGDGDGGTDPGDRTSSIDVSRTEPTAPPPPVNPDTCIQGYVWREAVQDDLVCVTPEMRDQVREDNQLADTRRVG